MYSHFTLTLPWSCCRRWCRRMSKCEYYDSFFLYGGTQIWQDCSQQWLLCHVMIIRQKCSIHSCLYPHTWADENKDELSNERQLSEHRMYLQWWHYSVKGWSLSVTKLCVGNSLVQITIKKIPAPFQTTIRATRTPTRTRLRRRRPRPTATTTPPPTKSWGGSRRCRWKSSARRTSPFRRQTSSSPTRSTRPKRFTNIANGTLQIFGAQRFKTTRTEFSWRTWRQRTSR